jgi:hypothetical protein
MVTPLQGGRLVPGRSAPPASVATSAEFSHRTGVVGGFGGGHRADDELLEELARQARALVEAPQQPREELVVGPEWSWLAPGSRMCSITRWAEPVESTVDRGHRGEAKEMVGGVDRGVRPTYRAYPTYQGRR